MYKHAHPRGNGQELLKVSYEKLDLYGSGASDYTTVIMLKNAMHPHYSTYLTYDMDDRSQSLLVKHRSLSRMESITLLKELMRPEELAHIGQRVQQKLLDKLEELLEEEAQVRRRQSCATKIYRCWYDACSNPYNPICQRRLLREFQGLVSD